MTLPGARGAPDGLNESAVGLCYQKASRQSSVLSCDSRGEAEEEKPRVASVSKCITTFMAFHQLIFEQKDLPPRAHLQCLVFSFEFITWI